MTKTNVQIVQELLAGAQDPEVVNRLMADESEYVSLTFDNPRLTRVMPWAGRHKDGKAGVLYTFQTLNRYWTISDFIPTHAFGEGEHVAAFGTFTVHSSKLQKTFVSPFAVLATVRNGKVIYMQYMEDTFGTGETFRSGGRWQIEANPAGGMIEI